MSAKEHTHKMWTGREGNINRKKGLLLYFIRRMERVNKLPAVSPLLFSVLILCINNRSQRFSRSKSWGQNIGFREQSRELKEKGTDRTVSQQGITHIFLAGPALNYTRSTWKTSGKLAQETECWLEKRPFFGPLRCDSNVSESPGKLWQWN